MVCRPQNPEKTGCLQIRWRRADPGPQSRSFQVDGRKGKALPEGDPPTELAMEVDILGDVPGPADLLGGASGPQRVGDLASREEALPETGFRSLCLHALGAT